MTLILPDAVEHAMPSMVAFRMMLLHHSMEISRASIVYDPIVTQLSNVIVFSCVQVFDIFSFKVFKYTS